MLLFSQIALVILTMVAPLIVLIVFAYVKAQGWKPVAWGIFLSLAVLVVLRLVIPLLVLKERWFEALIARPALYVFVYSLCLSLLYLGAGWLGLRRWKTEKSLNRAAIFGLSEGFAYEALFIGFNGLASLLSTHAEDIGEDGVGGIWLSILEALSMLILFTAFALWLARGLQSTDQKTQWLWMGASFGGLFALFYLGLSWISVWRLDRAAQELLLMAAAAAAGYWIWKSVPLRSLFSVEADSEAWEYPETEKDAF